MTLVQATAKLSDMVATPAESADIEEELHDLAERIGRSRYDELLLDIELSKTERERELRLLLEKALPRKTHLGEFVAGVQADKDWALLSAVNLRNLAASLHKLTARLPRARFTTALELKSPDLVALRVKLQKRLKQQFLLVPQVKVQLTGGFILQVGAKVYDASLETAYENYHRAWMKSLTQA